MKILLTGVAGFIGFHLASELLNEGNELIGIDNLNDYYDPSLKNLRLNILKDHPQASNFHFLKGDIADREFIRQCTLIQRWVRGALFSAPRHRKGMVATHRN